MPKSWTTSGDDFFLSLEHGARRLGLERSLRQAISDGRLVQGARLPSSRVLARDLGLARGTVSEAYGQLIAEGYLASRHGSGTWVAAPPTSTPPAPGRMQSPAPLYDFRPGTPDASLFPRGQWLLAARRALAVAPDSAFGRGDPRGRVELRTALAEYLGRARGVRVDPSRVVVCGGFSHALPILVRALGASGIQTLCVEDPGLPRHARAARAYGAEVVPIPVDEGGIRVDFPRDQRVAVLVTPAHQFPLGMTMHPARRAELERWSRESGSVVIEDDYDGEFRYDRQPAGAFQGLAPEHAVYCGTASKTLVPGLRLGWMAVPASLLDAVLEAKTNSGQDVSVFDQLTLADFISSGSYDRHIRRARLIYRRRRDALLAALAESGSQVSTTGIAAGLHVVLQLPGGADEERALLAEAARRSLGIHGLGPCYSQTGHPGGGLIVGYATPTDLSFARSLQALTSLLTSNP